MPTLPLVTELPYAKPTDVFQMFAGDAWSLLLNSGDYAHQRDDTNRYSYIAFDPFETVTIHKHRRQETGARIDNPFTYLRDLITRYQLPCKPELPPFQGGAVGYFAYDLCHYLENINTPRQCESLPYADLAVGLYDTIIAFDHLEQFAWVIATGFPAVEPDKAQARAQERTHQIVKKLKLIPSASTRKKINLNQVTLSSPFNEAKYKQLVQQARDYILSGDIFEVNLSHRFEARVDLQADDLYTLFLEMDRINPSPFSAFLNVGNHHILSSSPERFLLVNKNNVSSRPIKGTAPRHRDPLQDKVLGQNLCASEKDRAENIMIVDLIRNDLSKVCDDDSVCVAKLCGLESYPSVHHLVSVINGTLKSGMSALDALAACFPGGSITGAPKIRAMEIIYEMEPTPRGPYCGSIGCIGFNGNMDTSIVIRTLLFQNNTISYQAGGAIVLDSSPAAEYHETLLKSAAIIKTLQGGA